MPDQITEAGGSILEAPNRGRMRVLAISAGRGSSGVYPAETLREAVQNRLVQAGTPVFLDHPSATEAMDRPERSVRDLAGVFTADGQWSDEHNGIVGEVQVFAPYRQQMAEMAPHIGLSIRGDGEIETREGQRTVTHLAHINSVDFVTRAGRGGRVLELLESARPVQEARNVGQHLESRLHQDFTNRADDMAANGHLTREERIHLSGAVGQGLSAFAAHLEANAPQLYTRDIYDEPTAPAVAEGAPAPTHHDTPEEGLVPELTEAEVAALRDQAAQAAEAQRQLAEATARIAAAEAERDRLRLANTARPLIAARLAEADAPLPGAAQARVVEAVIAAGVPATDAGAVDTEALHAAADAAATREASYLAAVAPAAAREAYGAFGSANAPKGDDEAVTEAALAEYDAASARTFGRTIRES